MQLPAQGRAFPDEPAARDTAADPVQRDHGIRISVLKHSKK